MPKFRKRPVVIEARKFVKPYEAVRIWCGGELIKESEGNTIAGMIVPTQEGQLAARVGDWIIRGVKGEFYPCKPDIFEATYEPA